MEPNIGAKSETVTPGMPEFHNIYQPNLYFTYCTYGAKVIDNQLFLPTSDPSGAIFWLLFRSCAYVSTRPKRFFCADWLSSSWTLEAEWRYTGRGSV
ncbi:MAG: hypothetical protein JW731_03990 [Bacteroidales bacterium]|nr:hypothetical protein [Bacteroidales bacterium]